MPVRSFKILCNNKSADLTLRKVGENVISGGWTDGWGAPPDEIKPGETIGWQGESDAVLGGTTGWLKYDAFDNGGNRKGQLFIYWDNPYYGATNARVDTVVGDVTGLDGDDPSEFKSDESTTPSFSASGYVGDLDGGSNDPAAENLFTTVSTTALGVFTGIPALLGTQDIKAHAILSMTIEEAAQPGYSATSYSYSPVGNPTTKEWIGHWQGDGVDIVIAPKSGNVLTVSVKDSGSTPALSLTADDDVTKPPVHISIEGHLKTGTAINDVQKKALQSAVSDATTRVSLPTKRSALKSHLEKAILTHPAVKHADLDRGVVDHVSGGLAVTLAARGTIHLDDGVALTLMNIIADGNADGIGMRYQRFGPGMPSRDVEVARYSPPPR